MCCSGQRRYGTHCPIRTPCLSWIRSVCGLCHSSRVPVASATIRQSTEWPKSVNCCSHTAHGFDFCLLHRNHWGPPHFRRIHNRTHLSTRGRLCHQNYGKGRRPGQRPLLATLLRSVRTEHKPGPPQQWYHLGICNRRHRCSFLCQGHWWYDGCEVQRTGMERKPYHWRSYELQRIGRIDCLGKHHGLTCSPGELV